MRSERPGNLLDPFRAPLLFLGVILVAAGSILLLYIGFMVYQMLNHPSDLPIVQYILDKVRISDNAFFGTLHDPNDTTKNVTFDVRWSESVRLVTFLFIGALAFGILSRVVSALITSGTAIMKLAVYSRAEKSEQKS